METVNNQLIVFVTTYGIQIIGAIIILILGRIIAGIGRRIIQRILEKSNTDPSIISFVGNLVFYLIYQRTCHHFTYCQGSPKKEHIIICDLATF